MTLPLREYLKSPLNPLLSYSNSTGIRMSRCFLLPTRRGSGESFKVMRTYKFFLCDFILFGIVGSASTSRSWKNRSWDRKPICITHRAVYVKRGTSPTLRASTARTGYDIETEILAFDRGLNCLHTGYSQKIHTPFQFFSIADWTSKISKNSGFLLF